MNDIDFNWIDAVLTEWGKLMNDDDMRRELGYGGETTISRAMRESIRPKASDIVASKPLTAHGKETAKRKVKREYTPDDVAKAEQVIAKMGGVYKQALIQRYMKPGPDLLRAERMRISRACFMIYLKVAQGYVYGRVAG